MSRGIQTAMGILILLGLAGAAALAGPLLLIALYRWGLSKQDRESRPQCREVDPDVVVAPIYATNALAAVSEFPGNLMETQPSQQVTAWIREVKRDVAGA